MGIEDRSFGFPSEEHEGQPKESESGPSKEDRVAAKMEAISAQSPEISLEQVIRQAEQEVDNALEIWGTIDAGVKWYSVEGESKETMERWKGQADEIYAGLKEALASGDFARLAEIMGEGFHESDLRKITDKINAEADEFNGKFDDNARKLLSIGLWLWREQGGKWPGERKIVWKVLTKDSVKLSSILEEMGAPSCADTSFLIKAMAEQMGVSGQVKKVEEGLQAKATGGKMAHRYFETDPDPDTGQAKVMDYWWSRGTGGLKLNQDAFSRLADKKVGSAPCGK